MTSGEKVRQALFVPEFLDSREHLSTRMPPCLLDLQAVRTDLCW